jgi:hypothetical protein
VEKSVGVKLGLALALFAFVAAESSLRREVGTRGCSKYMCAGGMQDYMRSID